MRASLALAMIAATSCSHATVRQLSSYEMLIDVRSTWLQRAWRDGLPRSLLSCAHG